MPGGNPPCDPCAIPYLGTPAWPAQRNAHVAAHAVDIPPTPWPAAGVPRTYGGGALLRAVLLASVAILATAAPDRRLLDWMNALPGARRLGTTVTRLTNAEVFVSVTTTSSTSVKIRTSAGEVPVTDIAPVTEVAPQRPLTLFFLDGVTDRTDIQSYLLDRVMPGANAVLGRSIRVRCAAEKLSLRRGMGPACAACLDVCSFVDLWV